MYFGSLIGYKGMKIRELSEKFNVEIKFPNDRDQKEKKKSIVKIRGLPEGIESAKASLLADIKEINQQVLLFFSFSFFLFIFSQFKFQITQKKKKNFRKPVFLKTLVSFKDTSMQD